jgi:hypothetical protein
VKHLLLLLLLLLLWLLLDKVLCYCCDCCRLWCELQSADGPQPAGQGVKGD